MGVSRRKRKRWRRRAAGGATATLPPEAPRGKGAVLLFDWPAAGRGDLALLRRAIRADWPTAPAKTAALMRVVGERLRPAQRSERSGRLTLALCWVVLEADRANLRAEIAAEARTYADVREVV